MHVLYIPCQVHYPSDSFLLIESVQYLAYPKNCAKTGMSITTAIHSVYLQVNYLIDEAYNIGKGANTIISILYHFLANHSTGTTKHHFHTVNCCRQNKNRYLMYYLIWRVLTGLNNEIISFLPVGHTKFSPGWCFGLFKRQYRKMQIGCLNGIVKIVIHWHYHTAILSTY